MKLDKKNIIKISVISIIAIGIIVFSYYMTKGFDTCKVSTEDKNTGLGQYYDKDCITKGGIGCIGTSGCRFCCEDKSKCNIYKSTPCPSSPSKPSDQCANVDCGSHGHCDNGKCICDTPWSGDKCDKKSDSDGCKLSKDGNCYDHVNWLKANYKNDKYKNAGLTNPDMSQQYLFCCEKNVGCPCNTGKDCSMFTCPSTFVECRNNNDCGEHMNCDNKKCVCKEIQSGSNIIPFDINNQPSRSIQLVNNTSENMLHVFLQLKNIPWCKLSGNGNIYPYINWGIDKDHLAWDPVGAGKLSEVIIPKNGYIILNMPKDMDHSAFRVSPIKLHNKNDSNPITSFNDARERVVRQWPILIEGGVGVVADSSAVDGINFRMKYELTTNNGVDVMEIHKNPCKRLDPKYSDVVDIGCRNPALIDCNTPTCNCIPATQNCQFNDCSEKLFNIPPNLKQYIGKYDGGKGVNNEVVKPFINKTTNLKDNALKKFCEDIQWNSGDFTAYCYDYNDVGSSPWLTSPYKMKVTYMDL